MGDPVHLRRAEPSADLQRLLLRQRRRRRRELRSRNREPGREDRRLALDRPEGRRLPPDQADRRQRPHRRSRGPDGRPLREADLAGAEPEQLQALRHLARARDRQVRRAVQRPSGRRGRRGPAREVHRRQPAALGGRRLRPRGGGRDRRGHLRPAGTRPRAGLQPAGDQLHPRNAAARHRPRDGRLSVHRRGLAPVHGPGLADRAGRLAEPVLRRQPEVRRRPVHRARNRTSRRGPRGLHPQRLRGRRREARDHARAHGRQPGHVRGLRPRVRAAGVRRQRQPGAELGHGRRRLAARERRRCLELQRRGRRAGRTADGAEPGRRHHEGLLGRRDDPDLRQPQPAQERGSADLCELPDLRRGSHGGPQRLPVAHRPGPSGRPGRQRDPEQGGPAQRRRVGLAAPEQKRRRRRRPAPAVPVRCGHGRTEDRAVALLRAARLPARLRRPEEQHQHARRVRPRRPGCQAQAGHCGPPGDRRRADALVPDGHPRPAERPRPDPLRPGQGRRGHA